MGRAISLRLPLSIKRAAERLAKEDGVSLNQWIAAAVAEKVGVVETAAELFSKRAGNRNGSGLIKFLKRAPKRPPDKGDEIGGCRVISGDRCNQRQDWSAPANG